MKVLHISGASVTGGAGIGARRIHEALLAQGIDSRFGSPDPCETEGAITLFGPGKRIAHRIARTLLCRATARFARNTARVQHSLNILPTRLHRILNASDVDLVHFHWMNNELVSIREIGRIRKPVVWTLHDMWPISGSAHYRFPPSDGAGSGKRPDRGPHVSGAMSARLDRWTWKRKRRYWTSLRPVLVPVSRWLGEQAAASKLFPGCRIEPIPNALNMEIFKPIEKAVARDILNLPQNARIIAFCAVRPPYKGMDLLAEALGRYFAEEEGAETLLLAFGSRAVLPLFGGMPIRHVGRVRDEIALALLYSAADVTCVPSRMEAFGQTASESLACGTPVVAFRATGLTDVVDHGKNGYLAKPFDAIDLCHGIQWVLHGDANASSDRDTPTHASYDCARHAVDLSERARQKALEKFSYEAVSSAYLRLYRHSISGEMQGTNDDEVLEKRDA